MLHTDSNIVVRGVSVTAASGAASTFTQWESPGSIATVTTDGASAISPGDTLSVSPTNDCQVTKGVTLPVCTANSSAAASAGVTLTCQVH